MKYIEDDVIRSAAEYASSHGQLGDTFYLYDEGVIAERTKNVEDAMSGIEDDNIKVRPNHFAIKALPNPRILEIVSQNGGGFDAATTFELMLLEKYDLTDNEHITFTATNATMSDYMLAHAMNASVNIGDTFELNPFLNSFNSSSIPREAGVRVNPGPLKSTSQHNMIGNTEDSQFGMPIEDAISCWKEMSSAGIKRLGMHMMLGTNELRPGYFEENASIAVNLAEMAEASGAHIDYLDIGGGLGIPYRDGELEPNVLDVAQAIRKGLGDFKGEVLTEFGRFITGPAGYLVSKVTAPMLTQFNATYVSVNGSVNNASRFTTVKDAYHPAWGVSSDGRDFTEEPTKTGLTGKQCSSSDLYLKNSKLPRDLRVGDYAVIGMAGAHLRSNASNYNLLGRAGELLYRTDGTFEVIRRTEDFDDVNATLYDIKD